MWASRSRPVAGGPLTYDEITARVIAAGMLAPADLAIVVLGLTRAAGGCGSAASRRLGRCLDLGRPRKAQAPVTPRSSGRRHLCQLRSHTARTPRWASAPGCAGDETGKSAGFTAAPGFDPPQDRRPGPPGRLTAT